MKFKDKDGRAISLEELKELSVLEIEQQGIYMAKEWRQ